MFGLVSKKKYRELEEKSREAMKVYEKHNAVCSDLRKKCKVLETENMAKDINQKFWEGAANSYKAMLGAVRKENEELQAELLKYKQKYADELQKRLELAERVKEMEEGAGKDAEGTH